MKWPSVIGAAFIACLVIALCCGGQQALSCDRASACPGDGAPRWGDPQTCRVREQSPTCGQYWTAYADCMQTYQTCVNGVTDEAALNASCESGLTAYNQCCEGPPDSGKCP
jgi:hypothetical protein